MTQPMLEISSLAVNYGAIQALKEVSLVVNRGEIITLIGCNGAGKSTLLRTISGILKPIKGTIRYTANGGAAIDLTRLPPHKIVGTGIVQVPEGRLIFYNLTVRENLEMGAYQRSNKKELQQDMEKAFTLFPRLKERLKQLGGTLSGGEQQMLAISRALMAHPKLLLLDEPSLGIAPALVQQIFEALKKINQEGTTILLIEQDAYLALETAHRAYVLEVGNITLSGPAAQLLNDPTVKACYLGQA